MVLIKNSWAIHQYVQESHNLPQYIYLVRQNLLSQDVFHYNVVKMKNLLIFLTDCKAQYEALQKVIFLQGLFERPNNRHHHEYEKK